MRKIAIFSDGSKAVIDTDSPHTVRINGETPTTIEDATPEAVNQHFPDLEKTEIEIKQ